MVDRGVEAVMAFAMRSELPEPVVDDTGSQVVAPASQRSVPAQGIDWGLRNCWG